MSTNGIWGGEGGAVVGCWRLDNDEKKCGSWENSLIVVRLLETFLDHFDIFSTEIEDDLSAAPWLLFAVISHGTKFGYRDSSHPRSGKK